MRVIGVNSCFDGGSIAVVNIDNPLDLQFKLRHDTNSHFAQWFYFQLNNVRDTQLKITIDQLDKSAYPEAWNNYNICVSYDNQYWFRLETSFDGAKLEFNFTSEANTVYFAYFEPYSYSRHLNLIGCANTIQTVTHQVLGQTHEGRNLDLLVVDNGIESNHKNKIWIIARQHPGETMAEYFMEGLIHKIIDCNQSVANNLLKNCTFYLIPNMNPDGSYHGNLRVNSMGSNLNREWLEPTIDKSIEVFHVRKKMEQTGVDMFFDIHGDESIPYIFTAGCNENPSFSQKQEKLTKLFEKYFSLVNPDYQTKFGYEKGKFEQEMASLATYWIGNRFDCLAFTIEMPFKDNDNLPNEEQNWSGDRSYLLGESLLTTINLLLNIDGDIK